MDKKVVTIVAAVVACLGLFLPMAVGGNLSVSLTHLAGIPKALYIAVPAVLALAILRKAKPFSGDHGWLMGTAAVAVLLAVVAMLGGMNTLEAVAAMQNSSMNMFNALGGQQQEVVKIETSMGLGSVVIMVGCLAVAMIAVWDGKAQKQ